MRPFEIALVALALLGAACLLIGRLRQAGRVLVACAVAASAGHFVLEGAHWQMIPAYAAAGLLCLAGWKPFVAHRLNLLASSSILLACVSIALSFLLPMFQLPKPTGTYPVGTKILYMKDSSRVEDAAHARGLPRELMVQLWYPAEPSHNPLARYRQPRETNLLSSYQSMIRTHSRVDAPVARLGSPFPVILLNHGWHGRRTNDTFLAEELASHGYAVASIDHTYNANLVAFPDGRVARQNTSPEVDNLESSTPERVRTNWDHELLKQTADQLFVLDRLKAMNRTPGTPWFGRLNMDLIGAMGHSFGGAAATELCAKDPRVRGAINMDGWFFGAIQARGPHQPLLLMQSSPDPPQTDVSGTVAAKLDAEDSADLDASLRKFGGFVLVIKGATHDDFTDQPLVSPLRSLSHRGTVPAQEVQDIVRAYVLAFFEETLRGAHPAILGAQPGPFKEASFKIWP